MNPLRIAALAGCLALAAAPVMAQTTDRSWTGDGLRWTPFSGEGCNVSLMEGFTRNGYVHAWLRFAGTGVVNFTLGGEVAGNGQRSMGTYTARLPAGLSINVRLMRLPPGSLNGTILTLRGTACSVTS